MDWDKASVELSKKLDPKHVKGRTQGGSQVQYIEGWHAIAEANRIFGYGEWTRETVELRQLGDPREVSGKIRVEYLARVRITVAGVVRDGCGFGQGIDKDVGQAHESAVKEAETDAMKRALMTFGNPFGLALYDKSRENVGVDEPQVDHSAEAIRIIGRLEQAGSLLELGALWKSESAVIASVKEADGDWYSRIAAKKDAMKLQLQPEQAA